MWDEDHRSPSDELQNQAEAGADERRGQEGHGEAAEGVLGEAEASQAVGAWLELRRRWRHTPPTAMSEAGRPL